jgi:hypothetical protein
MNQNKNLENYFENVYLGKNTEGSLSENKMLQKLLSIKALSSSIDSRPLSNADYKKLAEKTKNPGSETAIDFESYIHPYECI